MKTILLALFLAVCALLLPNYAEAWSGPGHLAIAAEAYRELSPELKAEAFDVLKTHPDFAKWEKAYHPNPNIDLPMYVCMYLCAAACGPMKSGEAAASMITPTGTSLIIPCDHRNFPLNPDRSPPMTCCLASRSVKRR
jgi:hypothetical protein